MLCRNPKELTVRASAVLEGQARNVYRSLRHERSIDRMTGIESRITWADLQRVRGRVGAIWYLREQEMDARQKKRDAYVKRYRPIQTLDGLDSHPRRVELRRVAEAMHGFATALRMAEGPL